MEKSGYLARLEQIEGEIERMARDPVTRALDCGHIFRRMLEGAEYIRGRFEWNAERTRAFTAALEADA